MASDAVARATRFVLHPHPCPAAESKDEDLDVPPTVRHPEKGWRRIVLQQVLQQLLCWQVAWRQVLLAELVDLEPTGAASKEPLVFEMTPKRER